MIGTVFRSEDVSVEDRFDHWRELISRTHAPSDMTSEYAADFWAHQRLLELGSVTIWPASFRPARFRRSARMVRQSDPELYHVTLLLDGGLGVDHAGQTGTHRQSDLYVVDTSRPYDVRSQGNQEGGVITGVGVEFPKVLLPVSPDRVQDLLGVRLSGREGTGALLANFLTALNREAESLRPSEAPRLGAVVLDLVSAWLAQVLDSEASLSPETRQQVLVRKIKTFIQHNLHDSELTPPVVAAAHHISLSYLHRIFHQQTRGETVAAQIRRLRLEAVRCDLADSAQRTTAIHAIAARWGIPRVSDLTRSFRAAYGVSPKEYRLQALIGASEAAVDAAPATPGGCESSPPESGARLSG
ncbi:AraC family transcriptional regulator [Streptomyces griseoluteus]|uniref:AraC family transcriptional regulator n=1 Tax=Streptomyces griseoluteus TaxID=29306 RepID=UPI003428590A